MPNRQIYFDVETTGFPRSADTPLSDCPHVVQIAALLVDEQFGEVASFSAIIKPDGWTIPDEVAEIHGITTEKAMAVGIPIASAMEMFFRLAAISHQAIAHNVVFDVKFVGYEADRLGCRNSLLTMEHACTMRLSRPICQIPEARPGRIKNPSLIEDHQHFFNEGFDGAHDALVDVRACHRVHQHLIANNLV